MILYLIHGNAYYGGYGYMEHTFGIYTDIEVEILEIEADKLVNIELGGYVE